MPYNIFLATGFLGSCQRRGQRQSLSWWIVLWSWQSETSRRMLLILSPSKTDSQVVHLQINKIFICHFFPQECIYSGTNISNREFAYHTANNTPSLSFPSCPSQTKIDQTKSKLIFVIFSKISSLLSWNGKNISN